MPAGGIRVFVIERIAAFYRELTAQLKVFPRVINASAVFQLPLAGSGATTSVANDYATMTTISLDGALLPLTFAARTRT
jgi:hypothetical protein